MDRYPGGQFPYAAFFWPALVAASAAETASSIAAHFLGFSGDADGDHTPREPEGATSSKIALELHAVRLRDFTVAQSGVPTLLCTPLALHGAALPTLPPDTVSLPPFVVLELNDCSWPIGARPALKCDFSELTNVLPISMSSSIMLVAWLISSGFAREAGYHWSMPDDSRPRYASLLWPVRLLILLRGNPDCRLSPRRLP